MPFVETSVSRDIFQTIDLAREIRKNATIIGRAGVGKSFALDAYIKVANDGFVIDRPASMMTITSGTGNALRDLFRDVAAAAGMCVDGSIANMQRQMRQYDLSGHVLILDEAQHLNLQSFRELLELHNTTGLCLIFCGNRRVLKKVNTDQETMEQIERRTRLKIEINGILDEDTDRIANSFGVEGMDAYKILRPLGRTYHTDGVVSVLQLAKRLAGEKTIQIDHIRNACKPFPDYWRALK